MVSVNLGDHNVMGTIGVPVANTEVKVVDADGAPVPFGETGELCVRGPQVMQGYWQQPEESAKVLDEEGWLRTGDIAVRDERGYLRIVDRIKDMIIVSGFNVFPNELEDVISQHPLVRECAAIGVPNDKTGEVVKLFVVPESEALNKQDLLAFCRQQLTGYKVPRQIEFREDLPKTNVGKVLRRELRA